MEIRVPVKNENKIIEGQRAEHSDPKLVLKEGQTVAATVLAKDQGQVLLKVADLLVRAQTEGRPLTESAVQLQVSKFNPEQLILTKVQASEPLPNSSHQLPKVAVSFIVDSQSQESLAKLAITEGQTVAAKLMVQNQNQPVLKIANQMIAVKPELVSFDGKNVSLLKTDANTLVFIQNSQLAASQPVPAPTVSNSPGTLVIAETANPASELVLRDMVKQEQFLLMPRSNQPLPAEQQPNKVIVINPSEVKPNSDQFIQSGNTGNKDLPPDLKNIKQLSFQPSTPLPETLKNNETIRLGQDVVSFEKVAYNPGSQLIEGTINQQKILLKPTLEFKENIPLFLKFDHQQGQMALTIDLQSSKDQSQLMKLLNIKLGEVIVEDENNAEIIKRIIDNQLPLTKDHVKTIQNFIQASPLDAKTSIDLLVNQNLLLGIFYQFKDNNDTFLLKGMQKENKKNKKEPTYEFTILYESEKLGNMLIEIKWADHLRITFYCADQLAYDKIMDTRESLKESLSVKNIEIFAEVNKELVKKEPVTSDEIQLTNLDIRV